MGSSNMFALITTLSYLLVLSSAPAGAVSESTHAKRKTSGACPEKWFDASFVEMGCLFFNNTAQHNTGVGWEEANVICEKYSNATLVDIQSEMQMGFLKMELDAIANVEGVARRWWTAGTDVGREGRWFWVTTLTEVGDFVWNTGL